VFQIQKSSFQYGSQETAINNNTLFKLSKSKPICCGTGLVALDFVIDDINHTAPNLWAGGSCGNVLIILSYLGWDSYPISRFKNDYASSELIRDMTKWNVKTKLISQSSDGSTPIIIERVIKSRNGTPIHKFEWFCPDCGLRLPKYSALLLKDVKNIEQNLPMSNVYYFDRVSSSTLELAEFYKKKGALIFFEPSSIGQIDKFNKSLQVADIVKYSNERLKDAHKFTDNTHIPLEIVTLGSEGLRYRINSNTTWKLMPPYPVKNLKDTAGAGDWCSAGIIHILGRSDKSAFRKLNNNKIVTALEFGQALASLNCNFIGARGVMYSIKKEHFQECILKILHHNDIESIKEIDNSSDMFDFRQMCLNCSENIK
jgi:fructokinase